MRRGPDEAILVLGAYRTIAWWSRESSRDGANKGLKCFQSHLPATMVEQALPVKVRPCSAGTSDEEAAGRRELLYWSVGA